MLMVLFSTPSNRPCPITTPIRTAFGAGRNTTAQTRSSEIATTV
jgi:hypothetical protein